MLPLPKQAALLHALLRGCGVREAGRKLHIHKDTVGLFRKELMEICGDKGIEGVRAEVRRYCFVGRDGTTRAMREGAAKAPWSKEEWLWVKRNLGVSMEPGRPPKEKRVPRPEPILCPAPNCYGEMEVVDHPEAKAFRCQTCEGLFVPLPAVRPSRSATRATAVAPKTDRV